LLPLHELRFNQWLQLTPNRRQQEGLFSLPQTAEAVKTGPGRLVVFITGQPAWQRTSFVMTKESYTLSEVRGSHPFHDKTVKRMGRPLL